MGCHAQVVSVKMGPRYQQQRKQCLGLDVAGVGKSFLLKEIMNLIDDRTMYVTASTGVAACNIGGTTLHSFAGM